MNADSVYEIIHREFPVPEEIYPRAKWMGEAADACSTLSNWYRREESALVSTIQANGILSDAYELKALYRPYATVDTSLLREKEPDVFAACVHVNQAFAEKTLGRRRLYELVAEALGEEVSEHEMVNVSDVRSMLPAALSSLYVQEGEVFVKYAVVEREEDVCYS